MLDFRPFLSVVCSKTFAEQRPRANFTFGNSRNVELILDQQNSRAFGEGVIEMRLSARKTLCIKRHSRRGGN